MLGMGRCGRDAFRSVVCRIAVQRGKFSVSEGDAALRRKNISRFVHVFRSLF